MYILKFNYNQQYEYNEDGTSHVTEIETKDGAICKIKYLCNFWPKVVNKVDVNDDGVIISYAKCNLLFSMGNEITVEIPVNELKKLNWIEMNTLCILNPDVPKATEHIVNIILLQYNIAPLETATLINRNRAYNIDGNRVYSVGDKLIWADNIKEKPRVVFESLPNTRLVIDPDCTEKEAIAGIMRLVNLSNIGEILFSFILLYIQRDMFKEVKLTPKISALIYAPTGWKKTTYANLMTHIFNRDMPLEQPSRLDASSAAAINRLYERDNSIVLLDDYMQDSYADTIHNVLRVVGDGIEPARMRGYNIAKKPPRCGLLMTGEFNYYGQKSDAARLLPLKMTAPIDSAQLTVCQNEPLILSTFISFYIKWYISNYDELCRLINEWLTVYRNTPPTVHARLEETQFIIEASYRLFLTYCKEKEFIIPEHAIAKYNSFHKDLRAIIKEQDNRIKQDNGEKPRQIDYLKIIRELYQKGCFCLATTAKDFSKTDDDGIIKGDYICFRKDKLLAKIRTVEPSADFEEIIKDLLKKLALKPGTESTSRKLDGSKLRFYFVNRYMLIHYNPN